MHIMAIDSSNISGWLVVVVCRRSLVNDKQARLISIIYAPCDVIEHQSESTHIQRNMRGIATRQVE
jgi:hypothetical protein